MLVKDLIKQLQALDNQDGVVFAFVDDERLKVLEVDQWDDFHIDLNCLRPPVLITDIDKLKKAQDLLSDVYHKYGELLKNNTAICDQLSVADSCIIESIDYLNAMKKEI